LNGDSKEKIYTTNGEVSQIEAVKYGNKYYVVMLAGTDLIKIEIGNKFSVKVISDSATSMAIPQTQDYSTSTLDWDGYIYYTEDKTVGDYSDISGSYVYRVSVAGGDAQKLFWKQGKTVKFVGRVKDVLFYTYNPTNQTEVFVSDMTNTTSASTFENNQTLFLADTSISDISVLSSGVRDTGYLFYNSSSALMFKPTNGSARIVTFSVDGSELSSYNILFVTGRTVYLSTTTGIYKASIADDGSTTCETIVTMTAIYDGTNYAYDGSYIYFYAQLEAIDDDEEDSDTNYYMYRAKIKYLQEDKSQNYELLSYTQLSSRHTQGK
jgi:hypothetical protein